MTVSSLPNSSRQTPVQARLDLSKRARITLEYQEITGNNQQKEAPPWGYTLGFSTRVLFPVFLVKFRYSCCSERFLRVLRTVLNPVTGPPDLGISH